MNFFGGKPLYLEIFRKLGLPYFPLKIKIYFAVYKSKILIASISILRFSLFIDRIEIIFKTGHMLHVRLLVWAIDKKNNNSLHIRIIVVYNTTKRTTFSISCYSNTYRKLPMLIVVKFYANNIILERILAWCFCYYGGLYRKYIYNK